MAGLVKASLDPLTRARDVHGGGRPFFFHEVTDMGGEAISAREYTGIGKVTEFR